MKTACKNRNANRVICMATIFLFSVAIYSYIAAEVYSWLVFNGFLENHALASQSDSNGNNPIGRIYVYDEQLGYKLDTHSEMGGDYVKYANKQYSVKKPRNVYRIICVGGSTTIGIDNPKFSYPGILQNMFDFALKDCDKKVEVINAGAMGYNSWHTKLRAEPELDRLEPDMYVVMDGTNDILAAAAIENVDEAVRQRNVLTRQISMRKQRGDASRSIFKHDPSLLFGLLNEIDFVKRLRTEVDGFFSDDILEQKIKAFGFAENVEEFIREREHKGIAVALINYGWITKGSKASGPGSGALPYKFDVPLFEFGRKYVHDTLFDISRKFGIPFIDIQPWTDALMAKYPMVYRIFTDELHYTQFFNYFLAREVFETLRTFAPLATYVGSCSLPAAGIMDGEFAYCIGWGEYSSGFGLPRKISREISPKSVNMLNMELSQEVYEDGNGEAYNILMPDNAEKKGVLQFTVNSDSCQRFVEYYPRIFSNKGTVVVERFSDGKWEKISELVNYTDTQEWTPIGARCFFSCPTNGGDVPIRMTVSGKAQLFSSGEHFLFQRK